MVKCKARYLPLLLYISYASLPSLYCCLLNNGRNVMTTDNCNLCSPLYAKSAIFSWTDVVNFLHRHLNTTHDVICVIMSSHDIQYLRRYTSRVGAYPCIIQTQQPILPPTCLEITTESLFLCLKCTFHQHIGSCKSSSSSLDKMQSYILNLIARRCSMHLSSLYYIKYQLWALVFNISMVVIDRL